MSNDLMVLDPQTTNQNMSQIQSQINNGTVKSVSYFSEEADMQAGETTEEIPPTFVCNRNSVAFQQTINPVATGDETASTGCRHEHLHAFQQGHGHLVAFAWAWARHLLPFQ